MTVTFYFTRHGETQFNVENRVQGWCDSPLTSKGVYDAYRLGQGLVSLDFIGACTSDAGRAQETLSLALEARENERVRRGLVVPQRPVRVEYWPGQAEAWRPSAPDFKRDGYPALPLDAPEAEPSAEPSVPVRCDERLREWCFGDLEGESARRLRNRMFDLFGDDIPREEQNERLNEIADHVHATDSSGRAEPFAAIEERIESFLRDCGESVEQRGGGNVLVVTHALFIRTLVFMYARERVSTPPKIQNASLTILTWDDGVISVETVGDTAHLECAPFGEGRPQGPQAAPGAAAGVAV